MYRSVLLLTGVCLMSAAPAAPGQSPHYDNPDEVVVTLDDEVVDRLPCQRITLDYPWPWKTHQIGANVGRTQDGTLYASLDRILFESKDRGLTWDGWDTQVPSTIAAFVVLADDTMLMARANDDRDAIDFHRSTDRGRTWAPLSTLPAEPFDQIGEGFLALTQLRDGTLLFPVCRWSKQPEGVPNRFPQHVFRSTDGGRTWTGGGDRGFWEQPDRAAAIVDASTAQTNWPGEGGTFPGCLETHVLELADGQLLAAFRYSGYPTRWHKDKVEAWGGKDPPDGAGRFFKQVFTADSPDGGRSWHDLRPQRDRQQKPVVIFGETHGQLVQVPDGRVVMVHDYRYPYEQAQVAAHVSDDGGRTWQRRRYHLSFHYGYPSSIALNDGTIVTVTGNKPIGGGARTDNLPYSAQVIRGRVPAAE